MKAAGPTPVAVAGVASAAALVPLNSTMIAVALPQIAAEFAIGASAASVLITVYLVAMLIGQPLAGRVGDRVGPRRTLLVALVAFAVSSLAAAAAPTFAALVVARGGQAVFAAALVPSVQAILRAASPPSERGRTFGLFGSVLGVGAAGGPVLGGLLTQVFDWHAIFVVNVPIAAASLLACLAVAPADVAPTPTAGSTVPGRALGNPVFLSSFGVQAFSTLAQYALLLLTPIVLDARGWGAGRIGLVLSALTVGMIVTGPAGGRLGDRRGRRFPVLGGLALALVATAGAAIAGSAIQPVLLTVVLGAFGVGLGMATPSVMTAALESVPEGRTGTAGGVLSTSRYVGSIITSLALPALVAADATGSGAMFGLATAAMAVAVVMALGLPAGPPAPPAGRGAEELTPAPSCPRRG